MNKEYIKTLYAHNTTEMENKVRHAVALDFWIEVKQLRKEPAVFTSMGTTEKASAQFQIDLYTIHEGENDHDAPF